MATTTEAKDTASSPNLSPRSGGPDSGAAGALVSKLFDEHGRMVLGLCRLLLRDPGEAEDAAQQVFLSAHAALTRGSVPRNASHWLAAIARNECRARIHARMREPLALPELTSDVPDPLAAAIRATDLDAIWAAISSLPKHQRRALLLRELGGLSYHELGRALGVSHSAVESLLFRARRQVRRLVAAAAPLAFRDELARLIPGFDPGTASVAARVAAFPVALKLAGAAASVGVVSTGAAHVPTNHHRLHPAVPAAPVPAAVEHDVRHTGPTQAPALVLRRTSHSEPRREVRRERRGDERREEPVEVEQRQVEAHHESSGGGSTGSDSSGPGPGPTATVTAEHSGHSGSDSSGSGSSVSDSHSGSDSGSSSHGTSGSDD